MTQKHITILDGVEVDLPASPGEVHVTFNPITPEELARMKKRAKALACGAVDYPDWNNGIKNDASNQLRLIWEVERLQGVIRGTIKYLRGEPPLRDWGEVVMSLREALPPE